MKKIILTILFTILSIAAAQLLYALPEGQVVESGSATFEQVNANTLNITAANQTVINFNSFNIAQNETVNFIQSSNNASVLSRVIGNSASQIFGSLYANGLLVLVNPNGIHFGATANVQVNHFIASTLNISTNNFINGNYIFEHNANSPYASIFNEGNISTNNVALIGSAVNNTGIILANAGIAHLASGDKATVSFDQMGLIQVEINQATSGQVCDSNGVSLEDAIANSGLVAATRVFMTVKTAKNIFKNAVNQTGIVRANQVIKVGDAIRIVATGADVVASGTLDAGANGKILISSDESINVNAKLNITGAATLAANKNIKVSADIAADSGDLALLADYDLDGVGTFNQDAGTTISTSTAGNITIQSSGESTLANIISIGDLILNQAGSSVVYSQYANSQVQTAGSLYIGNGVTLNAANAEYSIGRDWSNSGTFNAGTSTVNLVSGLEAKVLGANIFYNFNVTEPGKIVRFDSENPQAILNSLNLKGSYGNLLTLTSIDPLKQWSLNVQGESDIQYALVSNLLNIRAPPLKIIHSSSLGNNTNLDLDPFWTGNGATNNWSDANNWDTGTTPTEYDIVTFDGVTGTNPNKDSILDAAFQGTVDDLNINGYTGTLTLARDLALRGNFNHQTGTFDAATYTVSFVDASKASIISGNNTFYNLVCVTPGKVIKFEAGKTQTILNNFTVAGVNGNLVRLVSTVDGSQWLVNVLNESKVSLSYIYVRDANNAAAYLMPMTLSLKGTNNSNWDLDYVWTGAFDGDLDNPDNYTCGGLVAEVVPTNTDTLTIPWLGEEANYPSLGTSNALLVTNNANIFGGTFNGEVINNNTITDDLELGIFFKGKFTAHQGYIYGATFTGEFIWGGGTQFIIDLTGITSFTVASGATWDGAVFSLSALANGKFGISAPVTNNGTITGGGFTNTVLNNASGTITGGGFLGVVTNDGAIDGGDFYQKVYNGAGAPALQDGIDKSTIPVFTAEDGDLNNSATWSWTMDGDPYTPKELPKTEFANLGVITAGETSARIDNYGFIGDGVYSGTINNSGLIDGGTFSGVVTNLMGIWGGTFAQAMTNTGLIFGGTFNGAVTNDNAIGGGLFNDAVVNTFLLAGGVFNGAVTNDRYIQNGIFNNTVTNNSYIENGEFFGIVTIDGSIGGGNFYLTFDGAIGGGTNKSDIPVFNGGDLDVPANWSVDGEPLSELPIAEAEVANSGIVISGSYSGELFFNYNIIDGGQISGLVYNAAYIYSGEFNGLIVNVGMISGGTFNNQIMSGSYVIEGETYDSDQLINVGIISGGIFVGPVYNLSEINDGVFFGAVANEGSIGGGNFYQTVDGDIGDGIDKSDIPVFNGGDLDVVANWMVNGVPIELLPSTGEAANSGIITSGSTATDMDNYGTINGGSFSGLINNYNIISDGTFSGTVNYCADGNQNVAAIAYNNLTLSGSGEKFIFSGTTVSGDFTINDDAMANLAADSDLEITSFILNEEPQVDGTWGSSASEATNQDDVHFSGTGMMTVEPAVLPTPEITNVSASQTINYGVASITLTGKISATGPIYPVDGETVTVTINGVSQDTTISGAEGEFSITFLTAAIPYSESAYTITYAYAGNETTLGPALDNTSTALTVNKRSVTVTADAKTKVYGAADPAFTYTATALVGEDVYTGALARAAGTNVGDYAIGQGTLTAGDNYTITFVGANLTISAIPLTITADNAVKTFGDNFTFAGTEFTSNGLINSDAVASVILTSSGAAASATVNGAPYSITPSGAVGTGLSNYAITYLPGVLRVNQSQTVMQGESVLAANNFPLPFMPTATFTWFGLAPASVPTSTVIPVSAPMMMPVMFSPVTPAITPAFAPPMIVNVSNLSPVNYFVSDQNSQMANRLMFPHGEGILTPGGMGVIPLGAEKPMVNPDVRQNKQQSSSQQDNY